MEALFDSFNRYVQVLRQGQPLIGIDKLMDKAVRLANRRVYAAATSQAGRRGMGTTLTAAAIYQRQAHLGHVGDSRAYLVRGPNIYQLTKDHSWVEEQLEKGLLSPEQARVHEWRNLITRALGTRPQVAPDIVEVEVRAEDVFIIASDGLHGLVTPEEILAEVRRGGDWQSVTEYLISLANERGGPDNITLVIAEVS
jgi:protein phosphatase